MYKKDDYILFMTNEPQVHFNEMFGYNDLTADDFEKTEHTGFIKSVIDEENYLVVIVRPILGFRCVVNEGDILRSFDVDELTDEERGYQEVPEFMAPNVYLRHSAPDGETLDEKCVNCAIEAMAHLFPEEDIAWAHRSWSSYLKSDMLSSIERAYDGQNIKQEKVDYFKDLLQAMRFKEYYFVNLDVCTLETVDRLLGVAHHQNMVQSVVGIKEYAFENFPLQQVRVLEFVDDGEQVFLPQRIYQRRIFIKDRLVDVSNHVVEGLNLACILVELPGFEKPGSVFVKALVQKQRFDTARFFVEQSLQILDDTEGRIQFRAIAHNIELERRAVI